MAVHFKPDFARNIVCHTTEVKPSLTNDQSRVTCQNCLDEMRTVDLARRSQICRGCGTTKNAGIVVCVYCFKNGASPYTDWNGRFNEWVVSAALNKQGAS